MKRSRSFVLYSLLAAALAGCVKKQESITPQALKADADRPTVSETKATLTKAFVYAFPLIVNYKALHDYFIDTTSGQSRSAPFF